MWRAPNVVRACGKSLRQVARPLQPKFVLPDQGAAILRQILDESSAMNGPPDTRVPMAVTPSEPPRVAQPEWCSLISDTLRLLVVFPICSARLKTQQKSEVSPPRLDLDRTHSWQQGLAENEPVSPEAGHRCPEQPEADYEQYGYADCNHLVGVRRSNCVHHTFHPFPLRTEK